MKWVINIYKKHREIINYIIVGGLTTVVSLGTYYICVFTFLDAYNVLQLQIANILSWIAAVTFAYFTNRKYVFESKACNRWLECGKFYLSRVTTLLLDMGIMFALVTVLGFWDAPAKIIVQVVVTIVNYILSKFVVFNKKSV